MNVIPLISTLHPTSIGIGFLAGMIVFLLAGVAIRTSRERSAVEAFKELLFYLLKALLVLFGLLFLAYVLFTLVTKDNLTPLEASQYALVLTIVSALFSWYISAHHSKVARQRDEQANLDRFGERSAEKVLNQSKQLFDIEIYLREMADLELDDPEELVEIILDGTRRQLAIVRSSNDMYVNDWIGVVSPEIRGAIKSNLNNQRADFKKAEAAFVKPEEREELYDELSKSSSPFAPSPPRWERSPSRWERVVRLIRQEEHSQLPHLITGKLVILVTRPVKLATATANFDPPLTVPPTKRSGTLLSSPVPELNIRIVLSNSADLAKLLVHMYPPAGSYIPPGEYHVEYRYELGA